MTNVSASRFVTTPLTFIFWPVAPALLVLVDPAWLCAKAREAEMKRTLIASAIEAIVRRLFDTIEPSLNVK
jgi:hypothetical protein